MSAPGQDITKICQTIGFVALLLACCFLEVRAEHGAGGLWILVVLWAFCL